MKNSFFFACVLLLGFSVFAQNYYYSGSFGHPTVNGTFSNLLNPVGTALDAAGNLYVADFGAHCINKFSATGTPLLKFGSYGWGDGEFRGPTAIAVDPQGNIYVGEAWGNRIQKFNANGDFIAKWGSYGYENGQFSSISDIVVDPDGNLLVADRSNRIMKFSNSGSLISTWSNSETEILFNSPSALALDANGNLFVVNASARSIVKLSTTGSSITQWGARGASDGEFETPISITIDGSGNLYVVDNALNNVQKFSNDGVFISRSALSAQYGRPTSIEMSATGELYISDQYQAKMYKYTGNLALILEWGNGGSFDGQFNSPAATAVDHSGNIFVVDRGNNRVQKFDASNNFSLSWGSLGSGNGQFNSPTGLDIDQAGNVYVVDQNNHRIQKFTNDGVYISQWGSEGNGSGSFYFPVDISIDNIGFIYVTDNGSFVQKFDLNGAFIGQWGGTFGETDPELYLPNSIVADEIGNIYISDGAQTIKKFTNSGAFQFKYDLSLIGQNLGDIIYSYLLTVDSNNNLCLKSGLNGSILKFDAVGGLISAHKIGSPVHNAYDSYIADIVFDSNEKLYQTDSRRNSITILSTCEIEALSIIGNSSACLNATSTYSVPEHLGSYYTWYVSAANLSYSQGNSSIDLTIEDTLRVAVSELTSLGCENISDTVNVDPITPTIGINGVNSNPLAFCAGITNNIELELTCTFLSTNTFTAELSDANGNFPGTVVGTSAITSSGTMSIDLPVVSGSSYYLRVTSSAPALTSSTFGPLQFSQGPSLTSINGASSICNEGQAVAFGAYPYNFQYTYEWSVTSPASIASNSGHVVSVNPGDASSLTVSVKAKSGECFGPTITKQIQRVFTAAPSAIVGPASNCVYTSNIQYSVPDNGQFVWYYTGPNGFTIASGNGTNTIRVNSANAGTGTLNVKYTNANGCQSPASAIAVETKPPFSISAINGPATVCPDQKNVTYSISNTAGSSYTWGVPAGAVVTSGQGTNTIKVDFTGYSGIANITIAGSNTNYCNAPTSLKAVSDATAAATSISGTPKVCANAQQVPFNLAGMTPGSSLTWTTPTGSTIGSQFGPTALVNFNSFTSGILSVTENFAGGCSGIVKTFAVSSVGVSGVYELNDVEVSCASGDFEIKVNLPQAISSNVSAFSILMTYTLNDFFQAASPYTPGPVLTSAGGLANLDQSFTTFISGGKRMVIYAAGTKNGAAFSGSGNVITFRFSPNSSKPAGTIAPLSISYIREGLQGGGSVEICPVANPVVRYVQNKTLLNAKVLLNSGTIPLGYNSSVPSQFNPTVIYGSTDAACTFASGATIYPNLEGEFSYSTSLGEFIHFQRDIPNTTDVTNFLNANDGARIIEIASKQGANPTIYDIIAADVDRNGYILVNDIQLLANRIVDGEFVGQPDGPLDWVFVPGSTLSLPAYVRSNAYPNQGTNGGFNLVDKLPGSSACWPIRKVVSGACSDIPNETYRGILLGDIATPKFANQTNSGIRASDFVHGSMVIDLAGAQKTGNGNWEIPVFHVAGDTIKAIDLQLGYDRTMVEVLSVKKVDEEMVYAYRNKNAVQQLVLTGFGPNKILQGAPIFYLIVSEGSSLDAAHWTNAQGRVNGRSVEVEFTSSTEEGMMADLIAYPNPTSSILYLSRLPEHFTCEIYNIHGESVGLTSAQNQLDVSGLSAGVYILEVRAGSLTKRIKFTKLN